MTMTGAFPTHTKNTATPILGNRVANGVDAIPDDASCMPLLKQHEPAGISRMAPHPKLLMFFSFLFAFSHLRSAPVHGTGTFAGVLLAAANALVLGVVVQVRHEGGYVREAGILEAEYRNVISLVVEDNKPIRANRGYGQQRSCQR
jgi:hypothetical protein